MSTKQSELAQFVMFLFREDTVKTMFRPVDVIAVVQKMYSFDIMQDINIRNTLAGLNVWQEPVTLLDVILWLRAHVTLMKPVVLMQRDLQSLLLGDRFWTKIINRRYKHNEMCDPHYVVIHSFDAVERYKTFKDKAVTKSEKLREKQLLHVQERLKDHRKQSLVAGINASLKYMDVSNRRRRMSITPAPLPGADGVRLPLEKRQRRNMIRPALVLADKSPSIPEEEEQAVSDNPEFVNAKYNVRSADTADSSSSSMLETYLNNVKLRSMMNKGTAEATVNQPRPSNASATRDSKVFVAPIVQENRDKSPKRETLMSDASSNAPQGTEQNVKLQKDPQETGDHSTHHGHKRGNNKAVNVTDQDKLPSYSLNPVSDPRKRGQHEELPNIAVDVVTGEHTNVDVEKDIQSSHDNNDHSRHQRRHSVDDRPNSRGSPRSHSRPSSPSEGDSKPYVSPYDFKPKHGGHHQHHHHHRPHSPADTKHSSGGRPSSPGEERAAQRRHQVG